MINLNEPIVFIHVPKCSGSSVRRLLKQRLLDRMILHYKNEITGLKPESISRDQAFDKCFEEKGLLVYGHFNRDRGFGVEKNVPWATQFITILREPFEQHTSLFKYQNKNKHVTERDFSEFIYNTPPNYLNHFPVVVTKDNYKDVIRSKFKFIGFSKTLDVSMRKVLNMLELPGFECMPRLNVSKDFDVNFESYRKEFEDRYSLEVQVYSEALKVWEAACD